MRVVSMNLWGVRGAWADRRAVLVAGLREECPDLVAFQEEICTARYDQTRDLLGNGYQVVHSAERETDGQGIAVASRWPIEDVSELDLNVGNRTAGFACTTLVTRIAAPVGDLLFVNHFPSWRLDMAAEREQQAVIAARAVEAMVGADTNVILSGD